MTGLCMAASAVAWAHQPLITDDAGTLGAGGNQFELALERDRLYQAGIAGTTRILPITLTRGLSDSLDVFVGVSRIDSRSGLPARDASGSGNPVLGFKWRFYDSESGDTGIAIKPQYLLPVSAAGETAGLGSARSSYSLTAILTRETGFGAVHANLFTSNTRYRDTSANPDALLFQASVAVVWRLGETWKLALDLGSKTVRSAAGRNRADYAEIGTVYSAGPDCDLAFGLIRGSDTAAGGISRALTAGITWRFK